MRRPLVTTATAAVLAALVTAAPAGARADVPAAGPFALETVAPRPEPPRIEVLDDGASGAFAGSIVGDGRKERRREPGAAEHAPSVLTAERARVILRSLTVPGWGQATVGRRTSATVFGLVETGIWATFTSFRVQEQLRKDAYERTARVLAGIDLGGRDEEFRRIVGSFISSDEYNLLVVYRDAANLYYDDPVLYRRYIDEHELKGSETWAWPDVESLLRYRGQRKDAQRARLRANSALAAAIINRLLSAVHAARVSAQAPSQAGSWRLEVLPAPGNDPTAFRVGVRAGF